MFTISNNSTSIIYLLVIIFFIAFTVRVILTYKSSEVQNDRKILKVQTMSVASVVILSLHYLVKGFDFCGSYVADMSFILTPLFLVRLSGRYDKLRLSVPVIMLSLVIILFIASIFHPIGNNWNRGYLLLLPLLSLIYLAVRFVWETTGKLDQFVTPVQVTQSLIGFMDVAYFIALLVILCAGVLTGDVAGWRGKIWVFIFMCLLLMLVVCEAKRLDTGKIFALNSGREEKFLAVQKEFSTLSKKAKTKDDRYYELFLLLTEYFESDMPFLSPTISMTDVATELMTNKMYLSRAINIHTESNFCQFVNYYRIKYAVDKFLDDMSYRVSDLATMSGFHTTHSFSSAFRLYVGISPSEWCRLNKAGKIHGTRLESLANVKVAQKSAKSGAENLLSSVLIKD